MARRARGHRGTEGAEAQRARRHRGHGGTEGAEAQRENTFVSLGVAYLRVWFDLRASAFWNVKAAERGIWALLLSVPAVDKNFTPPLV